MNNIITDYKIVTGQTMAECQLKVVEDIAKGWQPTGGVAIQYLESPGKGIPATTITAQAMIKYKEELFQSLLRDEDKKDSV